ncbi:MAG: imidazole glycerol phosphate synthase subunit HisH [Verrucomicrobiota bacterium]
MESTGEPMTGVIDYGAGNLRSVCNALEVLGALHKVIRAPEDATGISSLIFPGVGAFGDSMKNIRAQGLDGFIVDWVAADKPFLAICIGYQVLFESSEESPEEPGLGIFRGKVRRFPSLPGLKVPHMGWNSLELLDPGDPAWKGFPKKPYVYFVHSFFPEPEDDSLVAVRCDYGLNFAAAIRRGNLTATQFHPEKSQSLGLKLIENFFAQVPVAS